MKVLHVNKFVYRRGGAEAYMLDVANLQRGAGHDVELFGMQHPDNLDVRFAEHFPSNMELEPMPPGMLPKLRGAARMLWSTSARRGMAAVLAAFRPDVVHLHNIYHQLSPSVIAPAVAAGIPVVMTLHDYKLACPTYLFLADGQVCEACLGGHFLQAPRRRCKNGSLGASAMAAFELAVHTRTGAYGGVDQFLCPSSFMRDKMTQAGVYPDRLRVLHNFVDVTGIPRTTGPGGPVVYASRLSHEKGVDVLVRALAHLPGVRLELAGDGPERHALEVLAEQVAPGRVTFHGRVPKDRVRELMACAGVVAAPSRCYENQPLMVLEALAAGVPVAGSALGGIAELVRDGETGALARPDDPVDLARALSEVLDAPERAVRLGAAGRSLVVDAYDPDRHLADLDGVYAGLCRDRVGGRA